MSPISSGRERSLRFGGGRRYRAVEWKLRRAAAWLVLGAVATTACASGRGVLDHRDQLTFTNASPDVVRVYLRFPDHQVRLGRWEAFEKKTIALPGGTISAVSTPVRFLVVPVGARGVVRGAEGLGSTLSEYLGPELLLANGWSYSGSRVLSMGPLRRN